MAEHTHTSPTADKPLAGASMNEVFSGNAETGGRFSSAFELLGGKEAAFSLMNSLKLVLISNNLGDAKSIITHPATTTHQRLSAERRKQLGITQGLLRLSVGLEDSKDLIKDLSSALRNLVR